MLSQVRAVATRLRLMTATVQPQATRQRALAVAATAAGFSALVAASCEAALPVPTGAVEIEHSHLEKLLGKERLQRAAEQHLIHSRRGPGQFEEFRVFVEETDTTGLTALVQFGDQLEGHRGIVHGGATASVCDDLFGFASFLCVPDDVRGRPFFTANLSIDYRAPLRTNTLVRVHVKVDELKGRKLRMKAKVVKVDDGLLIAEASTLFIKATRWQEWQMYVASLVESFWYG